MRKGDSDCGSTRTAPVRGPACLMTSWNVWFVAIVRPVASLQSYPYAPTPRIAERGGNTAIASRACCTYHAWLATDPGASGCECSS